MTQATFFGIKLTLPFDDSAQVIDPVDFDRSVILTRMSDTVLIGFEELDFTTGSQNFAQVTPANDNQQMTFVLPAGQPLWAGHTENGQIVTLSFLVTKTD